jgi:hypothetical protein
MVQAPFLTNSQTEKQAGNRFTGSADARNGLRRAIQEGRWSWFHKLAQSAARMTSDPRLQALDEHLDRYDDHRTGQPGG